MNHGLNVSLRQATMRGGQQTITAAAGAGESVLYFACKRCMDVTLAAAMLIVLFPLLLLIAVLIKLDAPGPVIFAQERVGARRRSNDGRTTWENRPFRVYKFRTMVHNADPSIHEAYTKAFVRGLVGAPDGPGAKFKLTNDPRVTRVGRILRSTSLDELPQLVNVLKGEMSLVGPRPVPTYEVAEYQPWHRERLAALPGITGVWQVSARCQVSFEGMIRMDIAYVRSRSLWLDLRILLLTVPAVLSGRGAE